MAEYPGSETETRVMPGELAGVVAAIFQACKMDEADAALLAGALVAADQRGIHSHGTLRVPDYVAKLTKGGVDPRGRPAIASRNGAALVIDAKNAMGQIAAHFAMSAAIETARATHVAIAAVGNSNHCGAMDHWAAMALSHGMIGIAATNALPTMAPWGGIDKIVGINPLAVAIPGGDEPATILDIAFGATAHGKIRVYHQKGHPIPEGWAYDAEGRPTIDAAQAMAGLIQPIGGHKGVGLGIVMGMLSTLLSGAAYGSELGNMIEGPKAGKDGHVFMAIDVAAFQPLDRVKERADGISRQIQSSRRRAGVERLYPPGLLEAEFERRYASEGIPLNAETIAGIRHAADRFGIAREAAWLNEAAQTS
ncbi:Ldh family oxidoreductase [Taklimakanibacter deserti]|uniref:Ldh family oxidoreductase n=1 Tax=Taklimakanibacter deserti TaxID=2267839 RepID=UPI0013C43D4B